MRDTLRESMEELMEYINGHDEGTVVKVEVPLSSSTPSIPVEEDTKSTKFKDKYLD